MIAEIFPLGTSSGLPSIKRSFPCFAIRYRGEVIIFDAGENCQRQILKSGLGFGSIKHILISHTHIDHFLGLYGLIESMKLYNIQLPNIYLPESIPEITKFDYKRITSRLEIKEKFYSIKAIKVRHTAKSYAFLFKTIDQIKFDKEKTKNFTPMDFKNILSKGYILKGDNIVKLEDVANKIDGLSILYTGDIYKPDFDGIKADVVIHECTFLDEDDEAKTKKHSTFKDVINTKNKVDAKLVILTHISNKYEFQLDKFGNEFVIAKDLQKIFIKKDRDLLKVTVE